MDMDTNLLYKSESETLLKCKLSQKHGRRILTHFLSHFLSLFLFLS